MKRLKALFYISVLSSLVLLFSCKKSKVESLSNEQLIIGKWKINEVRLNVLYNGEIIRDSLVESDPQPENFIQFNPDESLEYSFNSTLPESGTYKFESDDSVYTTVEGTLYKWKILLLTTQIFNVQSTQPYPAIPGATEISYQTLIR